MKESVLIIDFGSQVTKLIARRIREQNVFSQILPTGTPFSTILDLKPGFRGGGTSRLADIALIAQLAGARGAVPQTRQLEKGGYMTWPLELTERVVSARERGVER